MRLLMRLVLLPLIAAVLAMASGVHPAPEAPAASAPAVSAPAVQLVAQAVSVPAAQSAEPVHTVIGGDTYGKVGNKYNADWRCLARENGDSTPGLIHPGETIRIAAACVKGQSNESSNASAEEPQAEPVSSRGMVVWEKLAECESIGHGHWSANTGNGYHGGLQFSPKTWNGFGGQEFATYAYQASAAEQITVAKRVLKKQGWGAWPGCRDKLDLGADDKTAALAA